MSNEKPLKVMICVGEPSGDLHAAALMDALRSISPRPIIFRGFGGDQMKARGAELLYHTDQTALIGISPILMNLPFLLRMMRHLKKEMLSWKPDLVLTVDYPGMNLRLADFAHKHGIPNAHYICPQVWAWHRDRIPKLAKMLDLLLCILPFEPDLFKETALSVCYTGHPLVDRAAETRANPVTLPWKENHRKIALLPGSRTSEIVRILPRMLQAAVVVEQKLGTTCSFLIPAASPKIKDLIEKTVAQAPVCPSFLTIIDGQARDMLAQADVAAVASGTATLEACLMRCPTVLVYCASKITYWVALLLIKGVKFLGLANIIAGRQVMPELLQNDFTPQKLADQMVAYLTDEKARQKVLDDLDETNRILGKGGASSRAAEAIRKRFPKLFDSVEEK